MKKYAHYKDVPNVSEFVTFIYSDPTNCVFGRVEPKPGELLRFIFAKGDSSILREDRYVALREDGGVNETLYGHSSKVNPRDRYECKSFASIEEFLNSAGVNLEDADDSLLDVPSDIEMDLASA